jgi:cell division protein FtsQ
MTRMARPRTAPQFAVPGPLPVDVRLMNAVANLVFALILLGLCAAALQWLTRAPMFAIRVIQIDGDLLRNNVATIRANAAPRLAGNFFSVDLQAARAAFEGVPWVRQAVVRRIWPDRLAVTLEEHRPAALWQGEDGNDSLVNVQGEVFEANVGDVEDEDLPVFAGPDGSAAGMLVMYRRVAPLLQRQQIDIDRLQLSGRGSWRVEVDSGAMVELGRGSLDEVAIRTERFVRTLPQVTGRFRQPLLSADLRHADGYAVRLRDVSTTEPPANGKRVN